MTQMSEDLTEEENAILKAYDRGVAVGKRQAYLELMQLRRKFNHEINCIIENLFTEVKEERNNHEIKSVSESSAEASSGS